MTQKDMQLAIRQHNEELAERLIWREAVHKAIRAFNGKVCNKRLKDAVEIDRKPGVYAMFDIAYGPGATCLKVGRYGNEYQINIMLNEAGRIDADATIAGEYAYYETATPAEDDSAAVWEALQSARAAVKAFSAFNSPASQLVYFRETEQYETINALHRKYGEGR